MERITFPFALFGFVESRWHGVLETLTADVRLFKDPRAYLTIRVIEQRITALRTPLEAIVHEAFIAGAYCGLTSLLAHSMTTTALVPAEIGTATYWRTLSRDWILGMARGALAAVCAGVRSMTTADTGVLIAGLCPFRVAEALRCAQHQVISKMSCVEVWSPESTLAAESELVAPASRQRACRELKDDCARIISGELLHRWLNGIRFCSGRARLFGLLRDKFCPLGVLEHLEGTYH